MLHRVPATAKNVARRVVQRLPERWQGRLRAGYHSALDTDEAFVARVYDRLLGRPPDADMAAATIERLRAGTHREEIVLEVALSHECAVTSLEQWSLRRPGSDDLPDLTSERPDAYEVVCDRGHREVLTFVVRDADDFDWLESRIVKHGYYELPGVWTYEVDKDKRLMADMVASFTPANVLEVGCSSGAVLSLLADRGISVTGVDISRAALDHAPANVRDRILIGDLLDLDIAERYSELYGLDIFEHMNPNRVPKYLGRAASLLHDGGWLFTVLPAFGADPVFGDVFPAYLRDWPDTGGDRGLYDRLHVDDRGYPLHGHLVWATWQWWVEQFERAGFRRVEAVERALHRRYDEHLAPARKGFFVFRKGGAHAGVDAMVARLGSEPAAVSP